MSLSALRAPDFAAPRVLNHGQFFGGAHCEIRTELFIYARMVATWPAQEMPRHCHENAYFLFVSAGRYVTAASTNVCGPGTLIFNPPGTTHRDRFVSEHGRFLTISVSPHVSRRMRNAPERPVLLRDAAMCRIVHEMQRELRRPGAESALVLEGLGLELAGWAARLQWRPDARVPKWLMEARDLLHEEQHVGASIQKVAQLAGVHRVHLARAFRQHFHCSPGEYLRNCRIEKAMQLLKRADLSIAQIAQQTGFCDQSQFARAFRRKTGCSPGDYQRACAESTLQSAQDVSTTQD